MKSKIEIIADRIAGGGRNIVFTGAGISTESGIPDYRSQGGIWDQFKPIYYDAFISSRDARIEHWRQKMELYEDLKRANPNPAHLAIVELDQMGLLKAVITQNIDGLHQAAGLPPEKVIELHGNTNRVRCLTCNELTSIDVIYRRIASGDPAPVCRCGGYLKTDTVSFGQAMPIAEMERAAEFSRNCDFFLAVGSTLVVHPAASLPALAKHSGAFTAIINLSETSYDPMFDVLIRGKAGEVMQEIVDCIRR
ncbi:MAG: NAD-dependent deacylase [Desulfobacteraceae bacterium]|nr:MAG: NAD-dependent deacylase [Desulfobacteraceae bacterium]